MPRNVIATGQGRGETGKTGEKAMGNGRVTGRERGGDGVL